MSIQEDKLSARAYESFGETPANVSTGSTESQTGDAGMEDNSVIVLKSCPQIQASRRERGTPAAGAVFIVVNACLGAGLLNFPAAFQGAGGNAVGVSMEVIFLVFGAVAALIMAYCSDLCRVSTYQDVVQTVCGRNAGILCDLAIILYTFGTCITFIIIVGDQVDKVMQWAAGPDFCYHFYMNRKFTMSVISILIILPLCIPKDIGFQKYASFLGVASILYVTVIVSVKYYTGGYPPADIATSPKMFTDVFIAVPTVCFGFQYHISAVPVYASMRKRTLGSLAKVMFFAMVITMLVYTATGVYGGLTFGRSVTSDVLLSYHANDVSVTIGRAALTLDILTSYPILHFCGRTVLDGFYVRWRRLSPEDNLRQEFVRRVVQTMAWFWLSLFFAIMIPNIGLVISVIGGLAAVFIMVFPGYCLVQAVLMQQPSDNVHKDRALLVLGVLYVFLGTFILGENTALAIIDDMNGKNSLQQICTVP
ncbi:PREDICTED: putative sodium-coupled neutral amino acid transporter 7 isoform X1 [Branchiostoma belcheri]|uniref:Sodium-coupled neutral amino acid transporter 7 isoform X1 n=1 Tax=Branchiostoma belcheri TaxID=7741 RepID=A0A6P4YUK9_BRABE|nr:PREDICTED: putative sodium-coupled neutral amino acid transporter 7 isoform X1 [Branchiostoma belcheri]